MEKEYGLVFGFLLSGPGKANLCRLHRKAKVVVIHLQRNDHNNIQTKILDRLNSLGLFFRCLVNVSFFRLALGRH